MPGEGESDADTAQMTAAREPDYLWQRWTEESGPFYRSCAVLGIDTFSDAELADRADKPDLEFCTGLIRLGLRHTPVLILFTAIPAFIFGQLNNFYSPIGTYLPLELVSPSFHIGYLLLIPGIIIWAAVLARIFSGTVPTDGLQLHRSILFYGTAGLLLAGVVFSVYLVAAEKLTDPRQHLTFRAGYFLFLLLEGHLAYDGLVLRGENLFWNFHANEIVDREKYLDFRSQLKDSLDALAFGPYSVGRGDRSVAVGPVRISPGLLFASVLLLPVTPLPVLAYETSRPVIGAISYGLTTALQIFLIAVLFHFVVLLWQFSKLLSGEYLDYKPFHPDEHGGYRALGRFATRVNTMLAVAGGYVAFRFLTGGLRQFHATAGESAVALLTWGISFLGPFAVYILVVILWIYFSFWRMHKQMQRGRRQKIQELQENARETRDEEAPTPNDPMEDLDLDAPAWEALRTAPIWPIQRRSIMGVIVLDTLPVLATVML